MWGEISYDEYLSRQAAAAKHGAVCFIDSNIVGGPGALHEYLTTVFPCLIPVIGTEGEKKLREARVTGHVGIMHRNDHEAEA